MTHKCTFGSRIPFTPKGGKLIYLFAKRYIIIKIFISFDFPSKNCNTSAQKKKKKKKT